MNRLQQVLQASKPTVHAIAHKVCLFSSLAALAGATAQVAAAFFGFSLTSNALSSILFASSFTVGSLAVSHLLLATSLIALASYAIMRLCQSPTRPSAPSTTNPPTTDARFLWLNNYLSLIAHAIKGHKVRLEAAVLRCTQRQKIAQALAQSVSLALSDPHSPLLRGRLSGADRSQQAAFFQYLVERVCQKESPEQAFQRPADYSAAAYDILLSHQDVTREDKELLCNHVRLLFTIAQALLDNGQIKHFTTKSGSGLCKKGADQVPELNGLLIEIVRATQRAFLAQNIQWNRLLQAQRR